MDELFNQLKELNDRMAEIKEKIKVNNDEIKALRKIGKAEDEEHINNLLLGLGVTPEVLVLKKLQGELEALKTHITTSQVVVENEIKAKFVDQILAKRLKKATKIGEAKEQDGVSVLSFGNVKKLQNFFNALIVQEQAETLQGKPVACVVAGDTLTVAVENGELLAVKSDGSLESAAGALKALKAKQKTSKPKKDKKTKAA